MASTWRKDNRISIGLMELKHDKKGHCLCSAIESQSDLWNWNLILFSQSEDDEVISIGLMELKHVITSTTFYKEINLNRTYGIETKRTQVKAYLNRKSQSDLWNWNTKFYHLFFSEIPNLNRTYGIETHIPGTWRHLFFHLNRTYGIETILWLLQVRWLVHISIGLMELKLTIRQGFVKFSFISIGLMELKHISF